MSQYFDRIKDVVTRLAKAEPDEKGIRRVEGKLSEAQQRLLVSALVYTKDDGVNGDIKSVGNSVSFSNGKEQREISVQLAPDADFPDWQAKLNLNDMESRLTYGWAGMATYGVKGDKIINWLDPKETPPIDVYQVVTDMLGHDKHRFIIDTGAVGALSVSGAEATQLLADGSQKEHIDRIGVVLDRDDRERLTDHGITVQVAGRGR